MLQLAHEAEISLGWIIGALLIAGGLFRVAAYGNHTSDRHSTDSRNANLFAHTQSYTNPEPNTHTDPYTYIHSYPHAVCIS
jgi:hypothetical protein